MKLTTVTLRHRHRRTRFWRGIFALWLSLSLAVPSPAYGLRPPQAREQETPQENVLDRIGQELLEVAQSMGVPVPARPTPLAGEYALSAAGMEGGGRQDTADDATGGAEMPLAVAKAGGKALLVTGPFDPTLVGEYDVVVHNTQTRNLSSTETGRRTDAVEASVLTPGSWSYSKMDSTLKGRWLTGIQHRAKRIGAEVTLIAPALLSQGRVTQEGVHGIVQDGEFTPLHLSSYGDLIDPGLVRARSNLEVYLRGRTSKVERFDQAMIEQGAGVVQKRLEEVQAGTLIVADITDERHLEILAQAVHLMDRSILCCGSSGLYAALVSSGETVALEPWSKQLQSDYPGRGKVLVLAGSYNDVSVRQVKRALRIFPDRIALVEFSTDGISRLRTRTERVQEVRSKILRAWQRRQAVVLKPNPPLFLKPGSRAQQGLANFFRDLIDAEAVQSQLSLLTVFGGDTLDTVFRAFDAGFTATGEVAPQVPYGQLLRAGHPPLPIITKAGGFSRPDMLINILDQVRPIAVPRIGVTMGDPAGSGPELLLRAVADEPALLTQGELLVIGDAGVLRQVRDFFGIRPPEGGLTIRSIKRIRGAQFGPGILNVLDLQNVNPRILKRSFGSKGVGEVGSQARLHFGRAALAYLDMGIELASAGGVDGLMTLPVTKEDIAVVDEGFRGHTGYLGEHLGTVTGSGVVTITLIHEKLRVLHVTMHSSLKEVTETFQNPAVTERIFELIRVADQMGRSYFGLERPRIGVLGLNPHAGEGGLLGAEDQTRIQPAIDRALEAELNVAPRPLPADTAFTPGIRDRYDFLLAMYHDQGHGPFKAISGFSGINFTGNLPIVRTTPDHGTGRSEAWNKDRPYALSPEGTIAAIQSAINMIVAERRNAAGMEGGEEQVRGERLQVGGRTLTPSLQGLAAGLEEETPSFEPQVTSASVTKSPVTAPDAAAGMEQVQELVKGWVTQAAQGQRVRSGVRDLAEETLLFFAEPGVLQEVLEDMAHLDRLDLGRKFEIWDAKTWETLLRLEHQEDGTVAWSGSIPDQGGSLRVVDDHEKDQPIFLREDLFVEPGGAAEPVPFVHYLRGEAGLPGLNEQFLTEVPSAIIWKRRLGQNPFLWRFPVTARILYNQNKHSVVETGYRYPASVDETLSSEDFVAELHAHETTAVSSSTDLSAWAEDHTHVPRVILLPNQMEGFLYVPRRREAAQRAYTAVEESLEAFDALADEEALQFLKGHFLIVPIDFEALARVQGIPLPAGMEGVLKIELGEVNQRNYDVMLAKGEDKIKVNLYETDQLAQFFERHPQPLIDLVKEPQIWIEMNKVFSHRGGSGDWQLNITITSGAWEESEMREHLSEISRQDPSIAHFLEDDEILGEKSKLLGAQVVNLAAAAEFPRDASIQFFRPEDGDLVIFLFASDSKTLAARVPVAFAIAARFLKGGTKLTAAGMEEGRDSGQRIAYSVQDPLDAKPYTPNAASPAAGMEEVEQLVADHPELLEHLEADDAVGRLSTIEQYRQLFNRPAVRDEAGWTPHTVGQFLTGFRQRWQFLQGLLPEFPAYDFITLVQDPRKKSLQRGGYVRAEPVRRGFKLNLDLGLEGRTASIALQELNYQTVSAAAYLVRITLHGPTVKWEGLLPGETDLLERYSMQGVPLSRALPQTAQIRFLSARRIFGGLLENPWFNVPEQFVIDFERDEHAWELLVIAGGSQMVEGRILGKTVLDVIEDTIALKLAGRFSGGMARDVYDSILSDISDQLSMSERPVMQEESAALVDAVLVNVLGERAVGMASRQEQVEIFTQLLPFWNMNIGDLSGAAHALALLSIQDRERYLDEGSPDLEELEQRVQAVVEAVQTDLDQMKEAAKIFSVWNMPNMAHFSSGDWRTVFNETVQTYVRLVQLTDLKEFGSDEESPQSPTAGMEEGRSGDRLQVTGVREDQDPFPLPSNLSPNTWRVAPPAAGLEGGLGKILIFGSAEDGTRFEAIARAFKQGLQVETAQTVLEAVGILERSRIDAVVIRVTAKDDGEEHSGRLLINEIHKRWGGWRKRRPWIGVIYSRGKKGVGIRKLRGNKSIDKSETVPSDVDDVAGYFEGGRALLTKLESLAAGMEEGYAGPFTLDKAVKRLLEFPNNTPIFLSSPISKSYLRFELNGEKLANLLRYLLGQERPRWIVWKTKGNRIEVSTIHSGELLRFIRNNRGIALSDFPGKRTPQPERPAAGMEEGLLQAVRERLRLEGPTPGNIRLILKGLKSPHGSVQDGTIATLRVWLRHPKWPDRLVARADALLPALAKYIASLPLRNYGVRAGNLLISLTKDNRFHTALAAARRILETFKQEVIPTIDVAARETTNDDVTKILSSMDKHGIDSDAAGMESDEELPTFRLTKKNSLVLTSEFADLTYELKGLADLPPGTYPVLWLAQEGPIGMRIVSGHQTIEDLQHERRSWKGPLMGRLLAQMGIASKDEDQVKRHSFMLEPPGHKGRGLIGATAALFLREELEVLLDDPRIGDNLEGIADLLETVEAILWLNVKDADQENGSWVELEVEDPEGFFEIKLKDRPQAGLEEVEGAGGKRQETGVMLLDPPLSRAPFTLPRSAAAGMEGEWVAFQDLNLHLFKLINEVAGLGKSSVEVHLEWDMEESIGSMGMKPLSLEGLDVIASANELLEAIERSVSDQPWFQDGGKFLVEAKAFYQESFYDVLAGEMNNDGRIQIELRRKQSAGMEEEPAGTQMSRHAEETINDFLKRMPDPLEKGQVVTLVHPPQEGEHMIAFRLTKPFIIDQTVGGLVFRYLVRKSSREGRLTIVTYLNNNYSGKQFVYTDRPYPLGVGAGLSYQLIENEFFIRIETTEEQDDPGSMQIQLDPQSAGLEQQGEGVTVESLVDQFDRQLVNTGEFMDLPPGLRAQFGREINPMRSDPNRFFQFLADQDQPRNEFQRDVRNEIAELVGLPQAQVLLIAPDNLAVWGLVGSLNVDLSGPTVEGLMMRILDGDAQPRAVILVRNDREDFGAMDMLAHEGAHSLQAPLVHSLASESVFLFVLMEGFQRVRQREIILELSGRPEPLGGQVREKVEQAFTRRSGTIDSLIEAWAMPKATDTFEQRLEEVLRVRNAAYWMENQFVNALVRRVGKEPVRVFYDNGDLTKLQAPEALGPTLFNGMKTLFQSSPYAYPFDKDSAVHLSHVGAVQTAQDLLSARQFDETWTPRLAEGVDQVYGLFLRDIDLLYAPDQIVKSGVSVFSDSVSHVVRSYAAGEFDQPQLATKLKEVIQSFAGGLEGVEDAQIQGLLNQFQQAATAPDTFFVITHKEVARNPLVKAFAGLEAHVFVYDDNAQDVVFRLVQGNAVSFQALGGLEQSDPLFQLARFAGITATSVPMIAAEAAKLIQYIFQQMGVPLDFIAAQLPAFMAGLEALSPAA